MSTENSAIFIIMVIILMTVEKLGIDTLKTFRSRLILRSGRTRTIFECSENHIPIKDNLACQLE